MASARSSDRFRIGDRLIQTRNSHELGLMNGSIVFLREDDPEEEQIVVDLDDGGSLVIPYGETATLKLAYAISVHKAQGCEVPVVVGVCHRSHSRMLTRPLLYTAITRARSNCVLVGDRAVLEMAVRRDEGGGRHSGLAARLAEPRRRAPGGLGSAPESTAGQWGSAARAHGDSSDVVCQGAAPGISPCKPSDEASRPASSPPARRPPRRRAPARARGAARAGRREAGDRAAGEEGARR